MNIGGWIMLVMSWCVIIGLVLFCFATMIRDGKL